MRAAVVGILTVAALAGCSAGQSDDAPKESCTTIRQSVIDLNDKLGPAPSATYDYTEEQKQARRLYVSNLRIIARIVVDHKECYSASDVATAQELLASTANQ
jgi:hypothetical protein